MKNKRFSLVITLFAPLFLFSFFFFLWSYSFADKKPIILKIIDGDTLLVEYKGKKENVRLIGIDTPESRLNRKALKDAQKGHENIENIIKAGREATRFVQSLLKPGDEVHLEFDAQIRDKYGRLLAYVYLSDGRMLNEEILKAGYAQLLTYPPNVKYVDRFLKAYREAREHNRGLWRIAAYKTP
ncbi:MAG: thermonuclease family protein [Thermodesulfobacteriota bacterium]